jgi:glucose/arabinose dehydrogenase
VGIAARAFCGGGVVGERIHDVRQGPDGALYLISNGASAKIDRVQPA